MFIISPIVLSFSPPVEDKNKDRFYSTHNPYSGGCEGIYRVCNKLGIDASRYTFGTTFLRSIDNKLLVIIDDGKMISDNDSIEDIKMWVYKGNKVLLISNKLPQIGFSTFHKINQTGRYAKIKYGKGILLLNSNPQLFTNANLYKGSDVFINMLKTAGVTRNNGEIVFDEYIHGYGRNENIWDVIPFWLKLSVIEALIIFLGIMVMYGRRFGRPAVILDDQKRNILEYYNAVAMLYRRSKDYNEIAKEYFDIFCNNVTKKYGGNSKDYETVKLIWKQRGLNNYSLLEECMDVVQEASKSDMDQNAFKACLGKIDQLKKEMGG